MNCGRCCAVPCSSPSRYSTAPASASPKSTSLRQPYCACSPAWPTATRSSRRRSAAREPPGFRPASAPPPCPARPWWPWGGAAYVLSAQFVEHEIEKNVPFHKVLSEYSHALLISSFRTGACNALHSLTQRCSRWMLTTLDRTSEGRFTITHEFPGFPARLQPAHSHRDTRRPGAGGRRSHPTRHDRGDGPYAPGSRLMRVLPGHSRHVLSSGTARSLTPRRRGDSGAPCMNKATSSASTPGARYGGYKHRGTSTENTNTGNTNTGNTNTGNINTEGACRWSRGCSGVGSADGRLVEEATMRSLQVVVIGPGLEASIALF